MNMIKKLISEYNACGMKEELEGTTTFYEAASCHYWNKNNICIKRHHQRKHLPNAQLYAYANLLSASKNKLEECKDFEALKQAIDEIKFKGIGDLTRYDIAVAIGYLQNPTILPEKYVYLHAGAKKGYNALVQLDYVPKTSDKKISIVAFDFLRDLEKLNYKEHGIPNNATFAMIVEDFLCVKHKDLEKLIPNNAI